jgi:hypothetical protein
LNMNEHTVLANFTASAGIAVSNSLLLLSFLYNISVYYLFLTSVSSSNVGAPGP